jgi:hypothetical protein
MKHEAVPAAHKTLQALKDECEIKQTIGLTALSPAFKEAYCLRMD